MSAHPGSAVQGRKSEAQDVPWKGGAAANRKSRRVPALTGVCLLLIVAAGALLSSCGSGGTSGNIPLPVVTVSPASASVPAGEPLQFSVSVVSPTSTTISWSVNNILGGNAALGTISTTGLYMAPAAIPNPSTVTIRATSSAETNPFGSAIVTIGPAPVNSLTLFPADSSTPVGTTVPFIVYSQGTPIQNATFSVNGVVGGNSTVGTISAQQVYTAPTAVPNPATVVVSVTNHANGTETGSTTLTLTAANTAPLFVSLGPNGNTGIPNSTHYNGLFTSVTICLPSAISCQTIPDILVDTSSVGLRVLNSALTEVPATELGTIQDSAGNQVQECVQFGDTSYAWGPALVADVVIGGEKAPSVPIQVIGDTSFTVPTSSCLTLGTGPSLDTVAALGANGILGVGTYVQDCGLNCAGGQTFSGYPYYVCPNNVCQAVAIPVTHQVANPVAFFAKDNNGVEIILPAIDSAGAPSLPYANADGSGLIPAGQLVFGVGTESNNGLGSATVYSLDANGNFPSIVYNSISYPSAGFLNSGSNALYILDPQTLGIPDCQDNPYYCPSLTSLLSLTVYGANAASKTINLNVANADTLFNTNPGFAAFNDLGGSRGTGSLKDYFDLGLPFFFGRSVFVGIVGTTAPNNATAPNGYVAF